MNMKKRQENMFRFWEFFLFGGSSISSSMYVVEINYENSIGFKVFFTRFIL